METDKDPDSIRRDAYGEGKSKLHIPPKLHKLHGSINPYILHICNFAKDMEFVKSKLQTP